MRWWLLLCLSLPIFAQAAQISIEVPRMTVAEYHKPYIAVWLESPDGAHLQPVSLWYGVDMPNGKGKEWLKDLRQWWRKYGRQNQDLDGFSGATRAPGVHTYTWELAEELEAGDYVLVVESVRELGGREMQKLPFTWPLQAGQAIEAQGQSELGRVQLLAK